ncbi:MAG: efflux transporter outer membrane subunit, partial [Zoogloea sp.]|nr:efflux transporter outer membrane subunit [Zoogloea sp.]
SLLPRVGPDYQAPIVKAPAAWQTPMPHGGNLAALTDWWRQLDDPLLSTLIDAAQRESASLAQARARIVQARSAAVGAGVAGLPTLDASREIDLFGGIARDQEGAEARLAATQARWHEARVSVAAETANAYLQLRYQERRVAQAAADAASRAETARLTSALGRAGFSAPAQVALATAGAADGASTLAELRAERDRQIKALVALTALDEADLRRQLASASGRFPRPARFVVDALPAQVLAQRPDVAAAERDLAAASAAIGRAAAARYPRLSLAGSITPLRLNTDGSRMSATTWSIGPTLSMPLFDGGRISANVDAARADYAAAEAAYRQKAREAVSEVEQALVRLDAAAAREASVQQAASDYRTAFLATEASQRAGFATLIDLEVTRRTLLAADANLAAWQQEQVAAWIALYRAVGGGWTRSDTHPDTPIAPQAALAGDAQ